ncbi:hypothetical protein EsH8_VI_001055 [Colletotrichum jinshuiense]
MARIRGDEATMHAAKSHFQAGTHLLVPSLQAEDIDHCTNLMAFWLMQLTYCAVWDQKACFSMKKLSSSISNYVEKHQLLGMFRDQESEGRLSTMPFSVPSKKSTLARFLLFAAYEDLDSEFCDAGGKLASLVLGCEETSETLFITAQDSQVQFFGSKYPADELMDDIERSEPLEFHFRANLAMCRANHLFKQREVDMDELVKLDIYMQNIRKVRQGYSSN